MRITVGIFVFGLALIAGADRAFDQELINLRKTFAMKIDQTVSSIKRPKDEASEGPGRGDVSALVKVFEEAREKVKNVPIECALADKIELIVKDLNDFHREFLANNEASMSWIEL